MVDDIKDDDVGNVMVGLYTSIGWGYTIISLFLYCCHVVV
jgi:hypothetical protein